ncbi:PilX N-terminal domain-containing pilus assembly protein [Pseudogulbenkiania sp. MAI-1]|uniref:pilus assembly PilX family protein n=1 Tax=Pseudogulbenkiania sp. MAI-1 TaxID=990370 RepID=UPI00045E8838|nr:PilX N-terminal domain-containing pilus assembly protein [Pseudogulbenkiania sp. MAI-1]
MRTPTAGRLNQRGSALVVALLVLVMMTMVVLASSRLIVDEQRIGSNQNDRQSTFQLAELALKAAEAKVLELDESLGVASKSDEALFGSAGVFSETCRNDANPAGWSRGLCADSQQLGREVAQSWERTVSVGEKTVPTLHPCGNALEYPFKRSVGQGHCPDVVSPDGLWANPRYQIELVDKNHQDSDGGGRLYRITVRAWGQNANSVVTLQSYYVVP